MTNEEFINALSAKAKTIVQNYQCKSKIQSIKVVLSDKSKMTIIDDSYVIYVNQNNSLDEMEYLFLHEFFHCIQKDMGFPNLHQKNIIYSDLSTMISSLILDLDVTQRLENEGYIQTHNEKTLDENIDTVQKLIIFSKTDQCIHDEFYEINQYYKIICHIVHDRFIFGNIEKVNKMLLFIKKHDANTYKIQSIIYDTIVRYGYDSPKKVYKIFKTLIRELELEDYIEITSGNGSM